jgi:hypothetical protein
MSNSRYAASRKRPLTTAFTETTETFAEPGLVRDQQPGYGWLRPDVPFNPQMGGALDCQHNSSVCSVPSVVKNRAYPYALRKVSE